jgi:NAD(P)-dependent dehydrogenase (short-subunit alcohol dehydrogenase family)
MLLSGKTVLITGGASGMGRSMVELFSAEGANVVAADINQARLDEVKRELPDVTVLRADISTAAGCDAAIAATGERLDILCNNAGITDGAALLDETSEELYDRVLAVNLKGPFMLSKRAVLKMAAQGGGHIINIASINGYRPSFCGASYAASKFGLVGLSMNIVATYGDQGIRCNVVCPGATMTNIGESVAEYTPRGRKLIAGVAADRLPAKSIAAMTLFLATDAAADINGAIIPVDRGWAVSH